MTLHSLLQCLGYEFSAFCFVILQISVLSYADKIEGFMKKSPQFIIYIMLAMIIAFIEISGGTLKYNVHIIIILCLMCLLY